MPTSSLPFTCHTLTSNVPPEPWSVQNTPLAESYTSNFA